MANTILGRLMIQIAGNTVELNKSLSSAQTQITGFQKTINTTNKLLSGLGVGFGLAQVIGVFKGGVNIIKDFEHQMSEVRAITGATDKEFQQLRDSAMELGRTTKFSAQEVAELQTEYGRLGFSTQEILDATEATINLSIATGSDLAKAADVAGSTVRGFGLNANETKRVVDVMAESFNKSALGIENFSEAMKYVAPVAKQAGLSVEQTTAILATLADAGIRGSQGGTSARKIISDLGTESGDLAERIEKLAAKGLTGAAAMDEVGRTAYTALLVLAENTKKTEEYTEALNKATGASDRAAKIMGDDLTGDLDQLSSAYEGLTLSAGKGSSVLRDFVQAITATISAVQGMAESESIIVKYFKTVAGVIPNIISGASATISAMADTDQSTKAVANQLERLNALRTEAEKRGDINTVLELNKAIGDLQARYKLTGLTIQEVNEAQNKNTAANKAATQGVTEQIGIIGLLEQKIKDFEKAKKEAFSVAEINNLNDKIKELKDQLEVLNMGTNNMSTFGKKILNAQAGTLSVDPLTFDKPAGLSLELPEVKPPDMTAFTEAFDLIQQKYKDTGIIAYNENQQMALAWDLQIEKQQASAEAAQEFGNVFGGTIGQIISDNNAAAKAAEQLGESVTDSMSKAATGQISFADAAKRVTAELLKTFLARALGGIISSAATSGGPPPVAIALAAAGVAAISAMFNNIGGPSKSVSGSISGSTPQGTNVQAANTVSNAIQIDFSEFRLEGSTIIGAVNNELYRSEITG